MRNCQNNLVPIELSPEVAELFKDYDYRNSTDFIMDKFIRESSKKYDSILKDYIKKNLSQFGYSFSNDAEFLKFVSERITRISFSDNPNDYEYYLDYKSEDNKGILIGITNEETNFEYQENKITVTIGRNFK